MDQKLASLVCETLEKSTDMQTIAELLRWYKLLHLVAPADPAGPSTNKQHHLFWPALIERLETTEQPQCADPHEHSEIRQRPLTVCKEESVRTYPSRSLLLSLPLQSIIIKSAPGSGVLFHWMTQICRNHGRNWRAVENAAFRWLPKARTSALPKPVTTFWFIFSWKLKQIHAKTGQSVSILRSFFFWCVRHAELGQEPVYHRLFSGTKWFKRWF